MAIQTGFCLHFFYNAARTQARGKIKQWDFIFSCLEEIGTRQGFSRKREKGTGDEIKDKLKYKLIRN